MNNWIKSLFVASVVALSGSDVFAQPVHGNPPCPEYCTVLFEWLIETAIDTYQNSLDACNNDPICELQVFLNLAADITEAENIYNQCCRDAEQ